MKTSPEAALAELREVFAPDRLAPLLREATGGEVRLALIPETKALVQQPIVVEKPKWAGASAALRCSRCLRQRGRERCTRA